jgi:hypothetical protein
MRGAFLFGEPQGVRKEEVRMEGTVAASSFLIPFSLMPWG